MGKRRNRRRGKENNTVKNMGDFGNMSAAARKIVDAARARAGMSAALPLTSAAVATATGGAKPAAPATGGYVSRYSFACQAHQFARPLFSIGSAHFYGGSRSQIEVRAWAMTICLLGPLETQTDGLHVNDAARALGFEARGAKPWLAIDCADGGAPDLTREDWQHIVDITRAQVRGAVGVYCLGGHGRTGTALAILAALGGAIPEGEDPIAWLRTRYCDEAVETPAQCRYVARITGREVLAEGSQDLSFNYGDWARASSVSPKSSTGGAPGSVAVTNAAGDVLWRADPAKGPVSIAPAGTRRNEGEGFWCTECAAWINRDDPVCSDCPEYPYKARADVAPWDEDERPDPNATPDPAALGGSTRELFEGFAASGEINDEGE